MEYTLQELNEMMEQNGGSLDLGGTGITSLPEGLTVGGSLDLSGTGITSLPEGLTVGGWLDLRGTGITSLPEGLTVGGWLDLFGTGITSLPEGLTVGGWLDLSGTGITSLPEGLTVGGWIYLVSTGITNQSDYKKLENGTYEEGRYLYADGILTHVKAKKEINGYTLFVGRIPGKNVVFDGEHYAHCKTLREGIADLHFKKIKDRGAEQYKNLTLDSIVSFEEAVVMYRVITGACRQGTERFIEGLKEKKEAYMVREMIDVTKGQYGAEQFAEFFEG